MRKSLEVCAIAGGFFTCVAVPAFCKKVLCFSDDTSPTCEVTKVFSALLMFTFQCLAVIAVITAPTRYARISRGQMGNTTDQASPGHNLHSSSMEESESHYDRVGTPCPCR